MFVLEKVITFEASHRLPKHDGKCRRLHGHSWKAKLLVRGTMLRESGPKKGMLMDFGDLKASVKELLESKLDHHHLNASLGLEEPTSELVAWYIWNWLAERGTRLHGVIVEETCTSSAGYMPLAGEMEFEWPSPPELHVVINRKTKRGG